MVVEEIVSIEGLHFQYNQNSDWILNNVNLKIYAGEWIALVGHNGSGKSTLAKAINGIVSATKGKVVVADNVEVNEETLWEVRKKVGMVFQNPDNQFVGTTVIDDVAFGLENRGVARDEMIERINYSLKQVGMEAFKEYEPHHLSGGQKQRVAIASILAIKPSVIILDEATSMLDPIGRREVIKTVKQLNKQENITVISITHDLEEMLEADRMIVMKQGNVYAQGQPMDLFLQRGDELTNIGLDIPFIAQISKHLIDKGISLSQHHFKHEDLVNELWTLYSTK